MNTEKEKLLDATYQEYLDLMIGDYPLDLIDELAVEDVMGYGTTLEEKILDINRLRKLVVDQREQGAGIGINFDIKPVFRRISPDEDSAIFVDEIDIKMIVEGNENVLPLRIGSVFEYIKDRWKLVHLHGSIGVKTDGDTWHKDELKKKMEELQKRVAEKTADLLLKNRELEIESSLERVRATALSMKEPADMLEVCKVISNQLQLLGIENIRNVQTAILNQSNKTYINYEYYKLHYKEVITEVDYTIHPKQMEWANEMLKSSDAFFATSFSGDELNKWIENQRKSSQFVDSFLEVAESLNYYYYSIGPVAIGMSTYSPLNDEDLRIFKKFKNVFELSYKRFIDIEKAEAQAREAQIEAALEKVRAVTMGMNKPDDLLNICEVLYKEFNSFGFSEIRNAMINIHNDEKNTFLNYDYSDKIGKSINHLEYDIHPVIKKQIKQIRSSDDAFSETVFKGADLNSWKAFRKRIGEKDDPTINKSTALYYYFYSIGTGSIGISTFNSIDVSKLELLKRFRNVFKLAYQRYKDIEQAESQAREAEIELALERVRSRAMAMHNSKELAEVAKMLFVQIKYLGVESFSSGFNIWDDAHKNLTSWMSNDTGDIQHPFELPIQDFEQHRRIYASWEKKESFIEDDIKGKALVKHYEFLRSFPLLDESFNLAEAAGIKIPERQVHNIAFFTYGYMLFITLEPCPQFHLIFQRFAKVFNQTYTRFLDLKKAEAQAREAQIEVALERVRAKTMAMQKSSELARTAAHLFEQLSSLGIKPYRCNIAIVNNELKNIQLWSTTNSGNVIPTSSSLPLDEYPVFKEMYDGWKTQKVGHTIQLAGEERVTWSNYISKYVPFDEYKPKNINKHNLLNEIAYFSMCYFRQGYFVIHTKEKISAQEYNIIQRFANVFEQTYTRFLDLENAEKQNKIIQAENERKTEELEEARQLQLAMLPKELPKLPNLDIAVYMQTATEVGGDYYDFHVDDKGVLTTVIGDATGHGMKAGTIVTITKSMFNSLSAEKNILKIFSKISRVIRDMKFRQLSMCLMMLKISGNKLVISSAAMPPAYIYRKSKKKADEIVLNGMPLGAILNFPYKVKETTISSGDTILLMSDGYPELKNYKGNMFGYEKALQLFEELAEKPSKDIIEGLKNSASEWVQNKMPDDDVTFVVIKIK